MFTCRPNGRLIASANTIRLILAFLCIVFSGLVRAETGKISITVVDAENRRPLADATINIVPREGSRYEANSDSRGVAGVNELQPGLYEVVISRSGYQSTRSPAVRVVKDKVTPLLIELAPSNSQLEEVLVVGKVSAVDRLSSAGTSYKDREALRSSAGSGSDILRALDGLPGLFSDGEFASFTVRGNGPRDNLILVDGIPFENVVHFDDSFGELEELEGGGHFSVFAPNIIDGAEFQPGGFNAAYGGRAGSLLKLKVAEGNLETPSYTVRLDLAGIELGYDGPSGVHDDTSILFSARKLDFGRFFETIGVEDEGSPELSDIIFKSVSQLGDRDKLSVLLIYAPEESVRDVKNVLASDEDNPGIFEDIELSRNKTDNSLYALSWSRLIGDSAEWVTRLYSRTYDERSWVGEAYPDLVPLGTPASEVPVRENILVSQREEKEMGLRTDFSVDNALGRFSAGLRATRLKLLFARTLDGDWNQYVYDQDDFRPESAQRYIVLTPDWFNSRFDQKGTSKAAYIDQLFEMESWDFRAGLRYDRDAFSDESLLAPRFSVGWQLNEKLRLTTTAGRYFQAPRFNDLASDAGNARLKNEQIDQFTVGFKYLINPYLEFFFEPYYQRLDNLVVQDDGVSQTASNNGDGKSYGMDMALTRRFDNGWSGSINYSYNDARVRDGSTQPYYDADFNRPHSFGIGGIWEINDRWKISTRWKWASGTPRDEFVVYDNVLGAGQIMRYSKEITAINTRRYDDFSSLNFRVDYRRAFGSMNLITFIDILNVYGADNPASSEFNERTGKDVIEDGETLPLFGMRLEW